MFVWDWHHKMDLHHTLHSTQSIKTGPQSFLVSSMVVQVLCGRLQVLLPVSYYHLALSAIQIIIIPQLLQCLCKHQSLLFLGHALRAPALSARLPHTWRHQKQYRTASIMVLVIVIRRQSPPCSTLTLNSLKPGPCPCHDSAAMSLTSDLMCRAGKPACKSGSGGSWVWTGRKARRKNRARNSITGIRTAQRLRPPRGSAADSAVRRLPRLRAQPQPRPRPRHLIVSPRFPRAAPPRLQSPHPCTPHPRPRTARRRSMFRGPRLVLTPPRSRAARTARSPPRPASAPGWPTL